jgi:hypothetical protein
MSDLAQPVARSWTRPAALLGKLALLVLILAALPLLRRSLERLAWLHNYPYPTDGLEGTLLHEARLLWSGQPLYQPLERYSFVSAPYPPLHPLFVGFADQFAGPHVFWSARLIAVIATLLIAATIAVLAWRVSRSWLAGLLGATIFLSAPPVLLWGSRVKPDLFALQWTTLGLCFMVGAFRSRQASAVPDARDRAWRWLVPALLCFWLAFLTKQTAVMAPFAAGLALLIADLRDLRRPERHGYIRRLPLRWRTAAFGFGYLALTLGSLLLLDLITAGQFTAHISGLHRSEWWSLHLVRKYVRLLLPYWPLMLLGAALLVRAIRDDRALLPACYGLVAPITLMGAAEIGANHNHLLETILALSILGGCALGWASRLIAERRLLAAPLLALFAVQIALAYQPQAWFVGELEPPDPPERFVNFIRNTPGEILADDVGLLLMAGKPIRYDDPSTMGPAAVSGVWDQSGLIEEISRQRFSAIMIPEDVVAEPVPYDGVGRWTAEVRAAIREHYELKFRDRINTYAPKPR